MGYQKKVDLPQERYTKETPFTYCSLDSVSFRVGPLIIKERRSKLKCYDYLFTFFSSCAVQIKVTNSLDADSFFLAFRRFIARKITVLSVWSDNGTNFVGTRYELHWERFIVHVSSYSFQSTLHWSSLIFISFSPQFISFIWPTTVHPIHIYLIWLYSYNTWPFNHVVSFIFQPIPSLEVNNLRVSLARTSSNFLIWG